MEHTWSERRRFGYAAKDAEQLTAGERLAQQRQFVDQKRNKRGGRGSYSGNSRQSPYSSRNFS